jgi:hypothetical protein
LKSNEDISEESCEWLPKYTTYDYNKNEELLVEILKTNENKKLK